MDRKKISLTICVILWSGIVSRFLQPLIHGNQEAINVIVTVYSVLAGFLIAIITLLGDPKSLPPGGWRVARLGSDRTYARLYRQKWLFKLYLITLMLIFFSMILRRGYNELQSMVEYTYLFFASVTCMFSFTLPSMLIELQKERIEQEIEGRRRNEGIK